MGRLVEFVLLLLFSVHLTGNYFVFSEVRNGTGYRDHKQRKQYHFSHDGEPDKNLEIDEMFCFNGSQVINLAEQEYIKFYLNQDECTVAIFGSVTEECTPTVTCSPIHFGRRVRRKCTKGLFEITDSLGGKLQLCGKNKFNGPYKPSENGADLYIKYENSLNKDTICMVVCDEDRGSGEISAKPLGNNREKQVSENCTCGIKLSGKSVSESESGRIVGGMETDKFEFPWMAALVLKYRRIVRCGGSLINDRYILTAAHCFFDYDHVTKVETSFAKDEIEVLLHAHVMDLSKSSKYNPDAPAGEDGSIKECLGLQETPYINDEEEDSIRLGIEKISFHPLWNPYREGVSGHDFDVALLRLSEPVDLKDKRISPVCLAKEGEIRGYARQTVVVAGWGKPRQNAGASSRVLAKASFPVVHHKKCSKLLNGTMTARMLCAGPRKPGKDSCQGDSGGPLIYKFNKSQYRQIGVVSWGNGCAVKDKPGVYTNVQEVNQWIYKNTHDALWCK